MNGLCLAAGEVAVRLALATFTLAWTHSVEKLAWQEDWRVDPDGLVLLESRVLGSGAGMEPGPEARLEGGVFRFRPNLPPRSELVLARSAEVADWRLCDPSGCRQLGELLPSGEGPVTLRPCAAPAASPPEPQGSGSNQSSVL